MLGVALVASALTGTWLADLPKEIVCEGQYPYHLQGVAWNGVDAIYWSFTTRLVKTDLDGKVLADIEVPSHHGDLCVANDRVYVAWSNYFNRPDADSKVYIYDADLALLEIKSVPEATYGAGGMDYQDGHFFIIGGLPTEIEENYVFEYDGDFNHVQTHVIPSGHTHLGIQTALFHDDHWWFGCYSRDGNPGLLVCDADLNLVGGHAVSPSIGLIGWGAGQFMMAKHFGEKFQAKLIPMVADEESGLVKAPK